MAQARAFQQGLNRAVKAEDRFNRNYARSDARHRQRGDRGGDKGTNARDKDYQTLKSSIERKGEIKYHAANEKKTRETAAQDLDDDGWGWIGEDDGKAVAQNDVDEKQNGTATNQTPHTGIDSNYIPPHKRAIVNTHLKKPKLDVEDDTEEDQFVLEDESKEPPLPPQRLMERMKLLDAYGDDGEGGVPLI